MNILRGGWLVGLLSLALFLSCADKRQLALVRSAEGDRHAEKGLYEQAIAAYQEAIKLYPAELDPHIRLGRSYVATAQYRLALVAFGAALALAPANGEILLQLGEVNLALGKYTESLQALAKAEKLLPGEFQVALVGGLAQLGADGFLATPVPPGTFPEELERHLAMEMLEEHSVPSATQEKLLSLLARAPAPEKVRTLRRFLGLVHLVEAKKHRESGAFGQALTAYQKCAQLAPSMLRSEEEFNIRFEYDKSGRLVQRTDANGNTTGYAYNALDQLVSISYPDGAQVSFEYDRASHLFRMRDATGTTKYNYDTIGRLETVHFPNKMALRYEYDAAGRVVAIHYPDDTRVNYGYNAAGELAKIEDSTGITTYEYNLAGDLVAQTLPNGIGTHYQYDAANRLVAVEYHKEGQVFLAFYYRLDGAGRPLQKKRITPTQTLVTDYVYSSAGRVLEEKWSDGTLVRYQYDVAGNRLRRSVRADTTVYLYDRDQRLLLAGDQFFDYDANGNLVERITPKGSTRYRYDYENRLVGVDGASGKVGFQYRGDGIRWARLVEGQPIYEIADSSGEVLLQASVDGQTVASFTWGKGWLGERGLVYIYDRPGGNVVGLCDGEGKVLVLSNHDLFGTVVNPNQVQEKIAPGFRGGRSDPDLGLVYLQGRYYDPSLGRFLTPSHSAKPSLHRYANPYGDLDFSHSALPEPESFSKVAEWAVQDPLGRIAGQALMGGYRVPINTTPESLAPFSKKEVLLDVRLPPLLHPAYRKLWGEQVLNPGAERFVTRLPYTAVGRGATLQEVAVGLALAHVQERWRWEPGKRQEHLVQSAGITYSAGGIIDVQVQAVERDVRGLEGFDELYARDLVPQDSSMHDTYQNLVSRSIERKALSNEFEGFMDEFPEGVWTPQVKILMGRQLLREGRVEEAAELYADMEDHFLDEEWGDDILMAQILVQQKKKDAAGASAAYEQLIEEFPGSKWKDDALYVVGKVLHSAGQSTAALEIFAQFADGFPESVWTEEQLFEQPLSSFLEEISRITSVVFDPISGQLILSGEKDPQLPPFNMDDLVVALRAIYQKRQDPAVSIGTEPSGKTEYKKVRYDGGTGGTAFGLTMFEADYALKTLSIGQDSTRAKVGLDLEGFQNVIDWTVELEDMVLGMRWNSRVWFVPGQVDIRKTEDGNGILVEEIPIVVQSESKFLGRGARQKGVEAFAQFLTENYEYLGGRYPSIRKLPQMAKIVAIAKWMRDHRIPVDLNWMEGYQLKAVNTPDMVRSGRGRKHATSPDGAPVIFQLEGGVSFREPNTYGVDDARVSQVESEMLSNRPTDAGSSSWTYSAAGKDYRAVALSLSHSRRDGPLVLAHTDMSVEPAGPELVRYYNSFETENGPFGPGWNPVPYALRFRRELTGAPGESEEVALGATAILVDRPNGRNQAYTVLSSFSSGRRQEQRLHLNDDGSLSLAQIGRGRLDFDTEGRLRAVVDRNGQKIEYRYQGDRLLAIADAVGGVIQLLYDASGQVVQVEDPEGRKVSYNYSEDGDLILVEDLAGRQLSYAYNTQHHLVSWDWDKQQNFQAQYDPSGRVLVFQNSDGEGLAFDYDLNTGQTTVVDRQGRVRRRQFDDTYRTRREMDAQGQGVSLVYTEEGQIGRVTGVGGHSREFFYDAKGNLVELRGPQGESFRLDYGRYGLVCVEGPDSIGRIFSYDERGNLVKIMDGVEPRRDALGGIQGYEETPYTTELSYDEQGLLSRVRSPGVQEQYLVHDARGYLVAVRDPEGHGVEAKLDSLSRITQLIDPVGRSMVFNYDNFDRVKSIRSAAGQFDYDYDDQGRLTLISGPVEATTRIEYEGANLVRLEFAEEGGIEYLYDDKGRLVGLKDPLGGSRLYQYNDSGRIVGVRSLPPEGKYRKGRKSFID